MVSDSSGGPDRGRAVLTFILVLSVLALGGMLSVSLGPFHISLSQILHLLFSKGLGLKSDLDPVLISIIWDGRLPRAVTAIFVGYSLGFAGAIMQGVFRNPMASPGVIGTSSGAALGAVAAIYLGFTSLGVYMVPTFAILFAFVSLLLVLSVATGSGLTSRYTLLLGGIAFNAMFSAMTSLVIVLATDRFGMAKRVVGWLMGDLTNRSWEHVLIIAPVAVVVSFLAFLAARDLNLLMVGEEIAANLGVSVVRSRNLLLLYSAFLTGAAIAVSGMIGFVGLIAPHVMRGFVGADHRRLLPAAGLLGGTMVVLADCMVRVLGGGGLRIGVLTALLGGPFFLFLLIRDKDKHVF